MIGTKLRSHARTWHRLGAAVPGVPQTIAPSPVTEEGNPWLRLTADLQLVQNLNKDDDLAVIPGGHLVLEF